MNDWDLNKFSKAFQSPAIGFLKSESFMSLRLCLHAGPGCQVMPQRCLPLHLLWLEFCWGPLSSTQLSYHLNFCHHLEVDFVFTRCFCKSPSSTFSYSPHRPQSLSCHLKYTCGSYETKECCLMSERGQGHLPGTNSFKTLWGSVTSCSTIRQSPEVQFLKSTN